MKHGFIKVAAVTPDVRVADCEFNKAKIIEAMKECAAKQVKIAVFPELCLTGYTCGDLFLQDVLLREAKEALNDIVEAGKELNMLVLVGLPLMHHGNLYNVAAASFGGRLLGIIPKKNIPSYAEFVFLAAKRGRTRYSTVWYEYFTGMRGNAGAKNSSRNL